MFEANHGVGGAGGGKRVTGGPVEGRDMVKSHDAGWRRAADAPESAYVLPMHLMWEGIAPWVHVLAL